MTDDGRRPKAEYEAAELGPFLGRMLRALVRRAAAGELEALEELITLERVIGSAVVDAARGAHEGPGRYSWGEIGRWIGITRQAAHARFAGSKLRQGIDNDATLA